jgi:hypothetical protein
VHLDDSLQLAHHVAMPTELEVGIDTFLECDESELLQAPDLRLCEVLEGELRQSGAAEESERSLKPLAPFLRWKATRIRQGALETTCVEPVRSDVQDVSGRPRLEHCRAEHLA